MNEQGKGEVYYGMHFYPGVAEYSEAGGDAFRIFINEDTIRKMNPTFTARPVYVEHVDEVEPNLDELRKEVDGWVIESFYNAADGKTWAKFIVVSEKGKRAIRNGYKLSNAYHPTTFDKGGKWNGVTYVKEVTGGEFEHLAIVKHPRYDESSVMTPEEFKSYNENKELELKRLANSKEKGEPTMKFFKKVKVENTKEIDIEGMSVTLPKSGKEMTIVQLVNDMDAIQNMQGYANGDHMVKMGENEMSVNDLVKKHMEMSNELSELKKNKAGEESEVDMDEKEVEVEGDKHNEESDDKDKKDKKENKEDDGKDDKKNKEDKMKNAKDAEKLANAAKEKEEKKKNFEKLKNAQLNALEEEIHIDLPEDQVARGQKRYGSN